MGFFYALGAVLAYSPAIVAIIMIRNGVGFWTVLTVGLVMWVTIFGTILCIH